MAYDPRVSDDQIGIFVLAGTDQAQPVENLFRSAGAVDVRHAGA